MNISFLFPGSGPYEALDGWVKMLARHTTRHSVSLARCPGDCRDANAVAVLTEANTFPRSRIDQAIAALREMQKPFGVVHNHEKPGVPTPGDYPSFCWTQQAWINLKKYNPTLLPMPIYPALTRYRPTPAQPLHLATFGHVEPKKNIWGMCQWARKHNLLFCAYGPRALLHNYGDYIQDLRNRGCEIHTYEWVDNIAHLAPLFQYVTHFLFDLTVSKGGTGGCPTSPRYATLFGRPVIVVDNELTCRDDGFYVVSDIDNLHPDDLKTMEPPSSGNAPDTYLTALTNGIMRYWQR